MGLYLKQIQLLKLLYKFRFVNARLLAAYFNAQSVRVMNERLHILMEQGFIGRFYEPTYKLLGKQAVYYLAPKGLQYLRTIEGVNPDVLRLYYKNKFASDAFVGHTLQAMAALIKLSHDYPNTFTIFSKNELHGVEGFPAQLPDLYIRSTAPPEGVPAEYLLEVATDSRSFIAKRRLETLVTHFDEEGWDAGEFPALLFVLPDARSERRFLVLAANKLESIGLDEELAIYTTTLRSITDAAAPANVWTNVLEPDVARMLH